MDNRKKKIKVVSLDVKVVNNTSSKKKAKENNTKSIKMKEFDKMHESTGVKNKTSLQGNANQSSQNSQSAKEGKVVNKNIEKIKGGETQKHLEAQSKESKESKESKKPKKSKEDLKQKI